MEPEPVAKLMRGTFPARIPAGSIIVRSFHMRVCRLVIVAAIGIALSACAGQSQLVTDSPGTVPKPGAEPAPAAAGRAARAPEAPPPPAPQEAITVTKAREQCWMLAEHQRNRDIDARVRFVEKCVQDKMK